MDSDTPAASGKKSNKKMWIFIIIVLIVIVALIAYLLTKNNNDSTANTTASVQSTNQTASTANKFAPIANSNQPYVATITSNASGQQTTATLTSDGKGNASYNYQANGQQASLVYTPTAYYLCVNGNTCTKYPSGQTNSSGFNPATYQYDGSKLDAFKSSAAYKGQQACPAPATGTCDIWSATSGGATTTLYINASTKKIAKVTTLSGSTTSNVTYDYKSVSVAVPANATAAPVAPTQ